MYLQPNSKAWQKEGQGATPNYISLLLLILYRLPESVRIVYPVPHMILLHGTHVFTAYPMPVFEAAIYRLPHLNFMNLPLTTRIGKFIHMNDLPQTTRADSSGKF